MIRVKQRENNIPITLDNTKRMHVLTCEFGLRVTELKISINPATVRAFDSS